MPQRWLGDDVSNGRCTRGMGVGEVGLRRLALVLIVSACACFGQDASIPVALVNPSFEQGLTPGGWPVGWRRYAGSGKDQSMSLVASADGSGMALALSDADLATEIGIYQQVDWPGRSGVTATVLVRSESPATASGSYMQIRFIPSGTYLQEGLKGGAEGKPLENTVTGPVPDGTQAVAIYIYTHKAPTPKIVVDDVALRAGTAPVQEKTEEKKTVPEPKPPVHDALKSLCLRTPLVAAGKAASFIVAPADGRYDAAAKAVQAVVRDMSGVEIPIVGAAEVELPSATPLIVLGNRNTNRVISELYDGFYTLLDLKYPGGAGHVVRSLHNPWGNGQNVILAGGSTDAGVSRSAQRLCEVIRSVRSGDSADLGLGWLMEIELAEGTVIPDRAADAKIWEESCTYGSSGYFGWNVISKCMALYYMTGREEFAKEFLRLAFPDEGAIQELETLDGERIENKHDPLAGPYHYSAQMMIQFWDLIEESPFFTDEQRLKITNAFSRQLTHRVREHVYGRQDPPASVGNRHGDWSAMALYSLARYFQRDYPDPIWECALDSCRTYFSAILKSAWLAGNNDHLFWYTSYYDPILDYMIMSGDRRGWTEGFLGEALRTQDVLFTGQGEDWGLRASSLNYLQRAAYVTGDAKWGFYRQRTGIDTDVFRLGQSFWADASVVPRAPTEIDDCWTIQRMPEPMWQSRHSGLPLETSFLWGSYRDTLDGTGDFILIKGHNGGGRNPYHTFALLELRLAGSTLLKGYGTQVLTSADGLVEPSVAMDASLEDAGVAGDTVWAVGTVPQMAFCNWERTVVRRKDRYCLFVDEFRFRTDSANMRRQTRWQTVGGHWDQESGAIVIRGQRETLQTGGWQRFRALDMVCSSQPSNADAPRNMIDLGSIGIRLVKATVPGDFLEMSFNLDQTASGELFLELMNFKDRGYVKVLLDGREVLPETDHFSKAAEELRFSLGEHSLGVGLHTLRVQATRRHEGLDRCYIGLKGLAIKKTGAAADPDRPYWLSCDDTPQASGSGTVEMVRQGAVKEGDTQADVYVLAPVGPGGAASVTCARCPAGETVLYTPDPEVLFRGQWQEIEAVLGIAGEKFLFARGYTAGGAFCPLTSEKPIGMEWQFASGRLALFVPEKTTLSFPGNPGAGLSLDGKVLRVTDAEGVRTVEVAAGQHVLEGMFPVADAVSGYRAAIQEMAALGQTSPAFAPREVDPPPVEILGAVVAPSKHFAAAHPVRSLTQAGDAERSFIVVGTSRTVTAVDDTGKRLWHAEMTGDIRTVHWWEGAGLLLVGCKDEKLIAFTTAGTVAWTFVSEMDQAVWEAAKQYWFKSAHPGVYGVYSGRFMEGREQCFIGGACTLEIIEKDGALAKRTPVFWGPGWRFALRDRSDGSRDLLIARQPTDSHALAIINSNSPGKVGRGFDGVPDGHTYVTGWSTMSRNHLFVEDMDGDGKEEIVSEVNGNWNRVTVWASDGRPLHNAQFGPGKRIPVKNIRSLDVADLNGDGRKEIIVATATGLLVALDSQCQLLWSLALPSPAIVLKAVAAEVAASGRVAVGCESGVVIIVDGNGSMISHFSMTKGVTALMVVSSGKGTAIVAGSASGNVHWLPLFPTR